MADDTDNLDELPTEPGTAEEPSGYIANFDGDEIDGKRYALGDRIDSNVDAGTIAFLVTQGRITPTTEGMAGTPSGGTDEATRPAGAKAEEGPTLTAAQQAEADQLVNDNTKDELLAMADGVEGVTGDNNKAEIAAKIVANRAA